MVLEKTLESPLNCKETSQSILKESSPGYSLEGLQCKMWQQHTLRRLRNDPSLGSGVHQGNGGLHGPPWLPSSAGHCCPGRPCVTTQWILSSGDNTALLPSEASTERIFPTAPFRVSCSEATADGHSPSQEASP